MNLCIRKSRFLCKEQRNKVKGVTKSTIHFSCWNSTIPTCLSCSGGWVLVFQIPTDCENADVVHPPRCEIIKSYIFILRVDTLCVFCIMYSCARNIISCFISIRGFPNHVECGCAVVLVRSTIQVMDRCWNWR